MRLSAELSVEDKAVQAQYAQALKACAGKIAPAQCQRQAMLDFKQAQHAVKIKRDALDVQTKRDKQIKNATEKANNVATSKQGVSADGKPLERAPLSKKTLPTKNKTAPLSKQSPFKNATKKERLAKQGKPAKGVHTSGSLGTQPTPDQRRDNVAEFAKKEQLIAARKAETAQKKNKRQAKDDARRAAGYAVDKP